MKGVMRLIKSLLWPAVAAACAVAIGIIWAYVQFGSLAAAKAYLDGLALLPDSFTKSLGRIRANEECHCDFELTNVSGLDVEVLGAEVSCSCVVADNLPFKIAPGQSRNLTLKVKARMQNVNKPFAHQVELYLSVPSKPIFLSISAQVLMPRAVPIKL
jgi:hypothetical protein